MAAEPGRRPRSTEALRSSSRCPATRTKVEDRMIRELRTILLVEDSHADAEMTVDALRDAKLANPIVHVEDGVEALDYLFRRGAYADRQQGTPAVVLLDIKMPRLDGLAVLREIRTSDMFRHTPVVILSSSREETDLARSW